MTFWQTIRKGIIDVLQSTPADLDRAWSICQRYSDQDFSIVDAVSFALMERFGITAAFSFDQHFAVYRTDKGQPLQRLPVP